MTGRLRCYGGQTVSGLAWTHDRLRIVSVTESEGIGLARAGSVVDHGRSLSPAATGIESEPV